MTSFIAIGRNSLSSNLSVNNVAVGNNSLRSNSTGTRNVSFGDLSLYNNTIGVDNTAIGHSCLSSGTSSSRNTALGSQSLMRVTTGSGNVSIGSDSSFVTSIGSNNVTLGDNAGNSNVTGSNNIYLGSYAGSNLGSYSRLMSISSTGDGHLLFGDMQNRQVGISCYSTGGVPYIDTDADLSLDGDQETIPAVFCVSRNTAVSGNGKDLWLRAGGCTPGETNKAGGSIVLRSGVLTGNSTGNTGPGVTLAAQEEQSQIRIELPARGVSGTTDALYTAREIYLPARQVVAGTAYTVCRFTFTTAVAASASLLVDSCMVSRNATDSNTFNDTQRISISKTTANVFVTSIGAVGTSRNTRSSAGIGTVALTANVATAGVVANVTISWSNIGATESLAVFKVYSIVHNSSVTVSFPYTA